MSRLKVMTILGTRPEISALPARSGWTRGAPEAAPSAWVRVA